MAKAPSSGVTCAIDDSGGVSRVVTSFVMTMGALKITNKTQPSTAFGDSWEAKLATGMRAGNPFSLKGLVDTTADTGTFATMIPGDGDAVPGFTRTFSIVVGGKTFAGECIIAEGAIEPKTGNNAEFTGNFEPTGACTWT